MWREFWMVKSPTRRLKDAYFDEFLLSLAGSEDGKIKAPNPWCSW
jgi:hypothetical protein